MAAIGNELSDDELHRRLVEIGVINCPVTASTRKIILKKYGRELMPQSKVSKSRNNQKSPTKLGFSSDEGEEFESSPKRTPQNHKFRRKSTANDATPTPNRRVSSPVNSNFKKPASLPRRSNRKSLIPESSNSIASNENANGDIDRRRTRSNNRVSMVYDMDISDSDNDINSRHSTDQLGDSNSSYPQDLWMRKKYKPKTKSSNQVDIDDDNIFRVTGSVITESPSAGRTSYIQNHERINSNHKPDNDLYERKTITKSSNEISNDTEHHDSYYANKHEKVRALFTSDVKNDNSPRNHHHHPHTISTFLLVVAVVFFIAIGIFYVVGMKQWNLSNIINNNFFIPSDTSYSYLSAATRRIKKFESCLCLVDEFPDLSEVEGICESPDCVHPNHAKSVLKCVKALLKELGNLAGKYECNELVDSRNITKRQALDFIETTLDSKNDGRSHEVILNDVLILFIKNNIKWNISIFSKEMEEKLYFPQEVWWLQSNFPLRSFGCRLNLALLSALWKIFSASCSIMICLGGYKLYVFYKRKQEVHKNKVYDLAEDIIGIIKKYHMQCKVMERADEQCFVPVTHVRDMLIPLVNRKKMAKIWEDACKIVEDNESRVIVEYQTVAGEDNKVWRWLENTLNGESNSKIWQGRAFENDISGINALSYSVTPCLKIRNMFSPDREKESNWETSVIDAVMEKCGDNHQIVHIAIANDSSIPEGCVYVKCKDNAAAGRAYKALHGCWFDGKLVTVKFLRLERYHEHYPEAIDITTPLKPSNNLKMSLSHDSLFSSSEVLERS
ncbi:Inner nuclear membrane protein Man1 [Nymphon striatum]|nr:Inner nuclear membrane protein Man1 [Nymphon striatum]